MTANNDFLVCVSQNYLCFYSFAIYHLIISVVPYTICFPCAKMLKLHDFWTFSISKQGRHIFADEFVYSVQIMLKWLFHCYMKYKKMTKEQQCCNWWRDLKWKSKNWVGPLEKIMLSLFIFTSIWYNLYF